jgi:hypothetical protein
MITWCNKTCDRGSIMIHYVNSFAGLGITIEKSIVISDDRTRRYIAFSIKLYIGPIIGNFLILLFPKSIDHEKLFEKHCDIIKIQG